MIYLFGIIVTFSNRISFGTGVFSSLRILKNYFGNSKIFFSLITCWHGILCLFTVYKHTNYHNMIQEKTQPHIFLSIYHSFWSYSFLLKKKKITNNTNEESSFSCLQFKIWKLINKICNPWSPFFYSFFFLLYIHVQLCLKFSKLLFSLTSLSDFQFTVFFYAKHCGVICSSTFTEEC